VCAALADLRGDRAEALAQVARHAAGLLAALRVALARRGPARPILPPRNRSRRPADPSRAGVAVLTVGVDVGGTRVRAGVVDAEGEIIDTARRPPAQRGGARGRASQASSRSSRSGTPSARSGLALAGFVTPDRRGCPVRPAPCVARRARGRPDRRTAGLPVVVEHDVNAAALAERRFGARRGAATVVFIALGTGIGAALLIDGELYRGAFGVAPSWGTSGSCRAAALSVRQGRLLGALLQRHRAGDHRRRAARP
jgi:hypothetical protein